MNADEQLLRAWEESGLTLVQIIERAGLSMTCSSLSRKLRGEQVLTVREAKSLADLFGVQITIGKRKRAA